MTCRSPNLKWIMREDFIQLSREISQVEFSTIEPIRGTALMSFWCSRAEVRGKSVRQGLVQQSFH